MRCGTGKTLRWTATIVSLFLVFVLPVCWATAMTQAWVERGQGPSSNNNTNEEREEREIVEDGELAQVGTRPAEPDLVELAPSAPRTPYRVRPLRVSIAPKLHPSQFSVKRLQ